MPISVTTAYSHHEQGPSQHVPASVTDSAVGSIQGGEGATGTGATDSDIQQLLRLLSQKDTLEKLQAIINK